MASTEHEPVKEVWGRQNPQWGLRAKPLVKGSGDKVSPL